MSNDPEIERIFTEDQSDRALFRAQEIAWDQVESRDRLRESLVKAALSEGRLQTGADYYHAAMILQHGLQPEEYLLAHELCIVAISKGEERAMWLAAASEDRFLRSIGRLQRFGTQHWKAETAESIQLYPVDPSVSDELRRAFQAPTLRQAEERVAKRNAGLNELSEALEPGPAALNGQRRPHSS